MCQDLVVDCLLSSDTTYMTSLSCVDAFYSSIFNFDLSTELKAHTACHLCLSTKHFKMNTGKTKRLTSVPAQSGLSHLYTWHQHVHSVSQD